MDRLTSTERPLVVLDDYLNIVYATPRFHELFDITSLGNGQPGNDRGKWFITEIREKLKDIIDSDTGFTCFELEKTIPGKGRRQIEATAHLISINDQDTLPEKLLVVSFEDLTERRKLEKFLQTSEPFSTEMLGKSAHPVLLINRDTSIRYVNQAFKNLTGFSQEELIGSKAPYPWWVEDTPHRKAALTRAIRNGSKVPEPEQSFRKKNGELGWAEVTGTPIVVKGKWECYLSFWVDLTRRKKSSEDLEKFISRMTGLQENERQRLAGEVHDWAVQSLASMALQIDAIIRDCDISKRESIERLKMIRGETDQVIHNLQRFCNELHPRVIEEVGLISALEILVDEFNNQEGPRAQLEVNGDPCRLPHDSELALFRIAQESLRNIKAHSGATEAKIRLKFGQGRIKLSVIDNGGGFKMPEALEDFAARSELGILGMRERARNIKANFSLKTQPGKGTQVSVEVKPGAHLDRSN